MRGLSRFILGLVFTLCLGQIAMAEQVTALPSPSGYVNDFAGVLTPDKKQQVEAQCLEIDQKAHAQIAVVTVNTIEAKDGGETSVEEFATELEDRWKVGAKGTDRGVLLLFVMNPRRGRIEVGYGLEGILNDAKVGDIGRSMVSAASRNDYNAAIPLGVSEIAQVIASDAGVTIAPIPDQSEAHQYHVEQLQQPVHVSLWKVIVGGGVVLLILIFLISTGNAGWIFFMLASMMGGGGGDSRDNDGGSGSDGGGFGGFGGGSSGGGGASGDF